VTLGYVKGLFHARPELEALVEGENEGRPGAAQRRDGGGHDGVGHRAARPRLRFFLIEEAAFLPNEDAAEPDVELVRAVTPASRASLASLLCVVSSPYARRGVLFDAWQKYGDGHDPEVVVVQAPTLDLNPRFDRRAVERALREDPVGAATEYLARWRDDVAGYVGEGVVARSVDAVAARAPEPGVAYVAHLDAAGGSAGGDDQALAVAHADKDGRAVLDAVARWSPPFSPATAADEAVALLRRYRCSELQIDRYAPGLVGSMFEQRGVACRVAAQDHERAHSASCSRC
jgi:hypothetical protein